MIEVRLIDSGPCKAIFDVHVNVVLAQRELDVLAVGVDDNQVAAGLLVGRNQRPFGCDDQISHPIESHVRARRCGDEGLFRDERQLLPGRQRLIGITDFNLALRNDDTRVIARAYAEFRSQCRYRSLRCFHEK